MPHFLENGVEGAEMIVDLIEEVGIDPGGRLYVKPFSASFPYIYREAMDVHWDATGGFLHSPVPRERTYFDWFKQILAAAKEQSCELRLSGSTRWKNIPPSLRGEIES